MNQHQFAVLLFTLNFAKAGSVPDTECRLHGNGDFNCTYSVTPGSSSSCTLCDNFSSVKDDLQKGNCDHITWNSPRCSTRLGGVCFLPCNNTCFLIASKIIINGSSSCTAYQPTQFFQPSGVQGVRVEVSGKTWFKIAFREPADEYDLPSETKYEYKVVCKSQFDEPEVRQEIHVSPEMENIGMNVTGLKPWRNYNCSLVAKLQEEGYPGVPVFFTIRTLPGVPLASPVIPDGAWSKGDNFVVVYWQAINRRLIQGQLQNYVVEVSNDQNNLTLKDTCHWVKVSIVNRSSVNLSLTAVTSGGKSGPTIFHADHQALEWKPISAVDIADNLVVWQYTDGVLKPDYVVVHYCYGPRMAGSPELIDCRNAIQQRNVSGNSMQKLDLVPPTIMCTLCDWHYAVSGHHAGQASAMVWSRVLVNETTSIMEEKDLLNSVEIAGIVVGIIVAALVIVMVVCCVKKLRVPYPVIFPKIVTIVLADQSSDVAREDQNVPELPPRPSQPARLRDSGNMTMSTNKNGAEEREPLLQGVQEQQQQEDHQQMEAVSSVQADSGADAASDDKMADMAMESSDAETRDWQNSDSESNVSNYRFGPNEEQMDDQEGDCVGLHGQPEHGPDMMASPGSALKSDCPYNSSAGSSVVEIGSSGQFCGDSAPEIWSTLNKTSEREADNLGKTGLADKKTFSGVEGNSGMVITTSPDDQCQRSLTEDNARKKVVSVLNGEMEVGKPKHWTADNKSVVSDISHAASSESSHNKSASVQCSVSNPVSGSGNTSVDSYSILSPVSSESGNTSVDSYSALSMQKHNV